MYSSRSFILGLAKQAAANACRVAMRKPGGAEAARRHMDRPAGNVQNPHRYGRKLQKTFFELKGASRG